MNADRAADALPPGTSTPTTFLTPVDAEANVVAEIMYVPPQALAPETVAHETVAHETVAHGTVAQQTTGQEDARVPKKLQELEAPRPLAARARRTLASPSAEAAPGTPEERHRRKCQICRHPELEAIEEEFVHWHYPWNIAAAYQIPARALYRHARALGLFARREQNLRSVLDRILERNERASLTGDTIIRALRAYTCLTTDNKWIEPASRVIFSSQALPEPDAGPGRGFSPRPNAFFVGNAITLAAPAGATADSPLVSRDSPLIDTGAIRK